MKFWPVLILCLLMAACARKADTRIAFDNSTRVTLQNRAAAGEAEAQFQLGNSYCCGENGFYDTAEAGRWWCKAAAQGYAPAQARVSEMKATCPSN